MGEETSSLTPSLWVCSAASNQNVWMWREQGSGAASFSSMWLVSKELISFVPPPSCVLLFVCFVCFFYKCCVLDAAFLLGVTRVVFSVDKLSQVLPCSVLRHALLLCVGLWIQTRLSGHVKRTLFTLHVSAFTLKTDLSKLCENIDFFVLFLNQSLCSLNFKGNVEYILFYGVRDAGK